MFHSLALLSLGCAGVAFAATADQWRSRSIYQRVLLIITDRYALPDGADPTRCNVTEQTWCGGTWNAIKDKLDYIQDAGFSAIWISPVSQNYEGPRTSYGDAYHGYWLADASQLNARFGTSDDLKALSAELHRRGMYLMVDIVANNVMATSTTPDYSNYMFKEPTQYHPYCPIDWNNNTSIQNCWLGDTNVTLPDINTQDPTVASTYSSWVSNLVQEYGIDGLRIDAAKHVQAPFWSSFCESAGVFCLGEVFGDDIAEASSYQRVMDSILNYPLYDAVVQGFTIPGPANMSGLEAVMNQVQKNLLRDPTLLGNFLENHDVPRWGSQSADPQSLQRCSNAMVITFMSDGIPIVYYGQEQSLGGSADPYNRGPLWPSHYEKTVAYNLTTTLNKLRNYLVNNTDWAQSRTQVLRAASNGIAIMKGNVVTIATPIGSPVMSIIILRYHDPEMDCASSILTCTQWAVGSNGTVEVQYTKGGAPVILVPDDILQGSGLCRAAAPEPGSTTETNGEGGVRGTSIYRAAAAVLLGLLPLLLA
ncbi:glycoside hydrolase family 13 protein [Gloeopeniophorella convolvens]|nr:glycoside hydrolase family 13 protein [Gloeopeniophorella convolvens]